MMRAILPGALLALLVTAAMLALLLVPAALPGVPSAGAHVRPTGTLNLAPACAEDDPCWTWSRMGNRKRGIVSLWGTPLVVGPCRYARMYARAERLGMAHLLGPKLRGDAWARAHGCGCK